MAGKYLKNVDLVHNFCHFSGFLRCFATKARENAKKKIGNPIFFQKKNRKSQ